MAQISILGCGWLGLPLAKKLAAQEHTIKGSTTSSEKISALQQAGVIPFVVSLHEYKIEGDSNEFLSGSDILIIDIPPKQRKENAENFVAKINTLIPAIVTSGITKVLFISSTSVYGNIDGIITETTPPNPETESGKQLLKTEYLLQSNPDFKTTIIRFGGLIGEDRHPVHYLADKENIANPSAPINLIHRDDCIGIIIKIIEKNIWGDVFNAVAPFHPTRKEYYTEKAKEKNLPIPLFGREEVILTKIISAERVKQVSGYNFMYTNL